MGFLYRIFLYAIPLGTALFAVTGCRVEKDEYPELQLPAPTPLPTPGPSNPGDSNQVRLDTAHWQHFNLRTRSFAPPAAGVFEFTPNGVRSVNDAVGYGSVLSTAYSYSLSNRNIHIIWRCYDGGLSSNFSIGLADSSGYIYDPANAARFQDLNKMATRTAYGGATLIYNNAWYYTTLTTTATEYSISTAAGDFAENGGFQLERKTGTLSFSKGRILLRSDQPGRTGCSVLINQLLIQ